MALTSDTLLKPFDDFGVPAGIVLIVAAAVAYTLLPESLTEVLLSALARYAPIWLTALFLIIFKHVWMDYVQTKAEMKNEYVVLEIKLPEEITQSPLAMETALNAFFHTGTPQHAKEKYIDGQLREQSSLEVVSFEGDLHFYIRARKKIRPVVESQLYSQYPTIEIHEVPDYLPRIPYDPAAKELFGVYQKLERPDPFPIKTYVEFGLDKETKEEFKVDPMAAILEFYGSLGTGEYGLFQIIIRSHQSEKRKPGTWFKKEDWKEEAKRETDKIIEGLKDKTEMFTFHRAPTEEEKRLMEALERNTAKKPFDAGIRLIYLAEKDSFDGSKRNGLPTIMRSFQSHSLNNFRPKFPTMFTYPWEDPFGWRRKAAKRELYESYRWRSYFSPPYARSYFVLSSEELATVYHLPGRVVQTPTIGRLTSRRAEAPPNLPR